MARWRKKAALKESPAHVDGKGFKAPVKDGEVRRSYCRDGAERSRREAIKRKTETTLE